MSSPTDQLFWAVSRSDVEAVRSALAAGADANARGPSGGETPLMQLRLCSEPQAILQLLLRAGADPAITDMAGRTALHHVALCPDPGSIEAVLARGVNAHHRDSFGQRALDFCLHAASAPVIDRLIDAMAPLDRDDRSRLFIRYLQRGESDAALAMLAEGIQLGPLTPAGYPPLHLAARKGDLRLTAALLDAGAKLEEEFGAGETALTAAAQHGHAEVVAALLARGANAMHRDRSGASSLHLAAGSRLALQRQLLAVIHHLLAAGADPLLRDDSGYWPRARARARGNTGLLSALAEMPGEPPLDPSAARVATVQLANNGSHRLLWRPNDVLMPFSLDEHVQRDEWHGRWLDAQGLAQEASAWMQEPELAWFAPLLEAMCAGEMPTLDKVRRTCERVAQRSLTITTFRAG